MYATFYKIYDDILNLKQGGWSLHVYYVMLKSKQEELIEYHPPIVNLLKQHEVFVAKFVFGFDDKFAAETIRQVDAIRYCCMVGNFIHLIVTRLEILHVIGIVS